jgi:hypothetical protein
MARYIAVKIFQGLRIVVTDRKNKANGLLEGFFEYDYVQEAILRSAFNRLWYSYPDIPLAITLAY